MSINLPSAQLTEVIKERAEQQRESIVELCRRLVAARSVNPLGDTRDVAAEVLRTLTDLGVEAHTEWAVATMPSVLAEIDSGRPGPHLVLNVHLDTMPPGDDSAWSVPIWEMTRTNGRLYGLGMGNMKGAVAAMIHAVALLREFSDLWDGRVTFTAVSDEVVFGSNGAQYLLATHDDLLGDGLICGEGPGYRRLAVGEKGVLWLEVTATGDAGHSSSVVAGASASARLAAAIGQIDALTGIRAAIPDELEGRIADSGNREFELTANVGTVTAGTFVGQVAIDGRAEIDLRLPPGISADQAEEFVRDIALAGEGLSVSRIKGWDPNWTSPDSVLARSWAAVSDAHLTEHLEYAIRLPASDASRWRQHGVDALCYGPQPTLSAGIDDYAEEDEVIRCVWLYALSALTFLGSYNTNGEPHEAR